RVLVIAGLVGGPLVVGRPLGRHLVRAAVRRPRGRWGGTGRGERLVAAAVLALAAGPVAAEHQRRPAGNFAVEDGDLGGFRFEPGEPQQLVGGDDVVAVQIELNELFRGAAVLLGGLPPLPEFDLAVLVQVVGVEPLGQVLGQVAVAHGDGPLLVGLAARILVAPAAALTRVGGVVPAAPAVVLAGVPRPVLFESDVAVAVAVDLVEVR